MYGNPLGGLSFGGETLDYFCLAIRPKNIDHPAKSGIFSRHENGQVFGHFANMRLRRPGSSQNRPPHSKEPTTAGINRNWVKAFSRLASSHTVIGG
jgi:hypothetical protein